jgi:CubicO group peptidase (beta-lactamase class C family)
MRILKTICLLWLCSQINSQEPFPKKNLDYVISQLVIKYKIPNVSIAITDKERVVYSLTTLNTGIDTLFLIGSTTKSFTALAILQLVDSGLVHLDKPVGFYLPDFSFLNEAADKKITVRHLLNQTSGLPQSGGFYQNSTTDSGVFQKAFMAYLKTLYPKNSIGEAFEYCNSNYVLLGLIIQKVTGKTYHKYVKEYIFKPLSMNQSYANYDSTIARGLIEGYQNAFLLPQKSPTKWYSDFDVAEGRIASTANDLCAYLRAVLPDTSEKHKQDTIIKALNISSKLYQEWLNPVQDDYAMGWGETHYFGQKVGQHLGLNENFNAALFFMPQQLYGVAVLGNTNSLEFNKEVKEAIVLTLLNKPYTERFSIELIERAATGALVLWTFVCVLYQFNGWRLRKFRLGLPPFWSFVRFLFGIGLSVAPVLVLPKLFNIPIEAMMRYQPDFAYGFIGIAAFGVLASVLRLCKKSSRDVMND